MTRPRTIVLSLLLAACGVLPAGAAWASTPGITVDGTGFSVPPDGPSLGMGATVLVEWTYRGTHGTSTLVVTQGDATAPFNDRHWVGWTQLPTPVPVSACITLVRVDSTSVHDEVHLTGPSGCTGPTVVEVPMSAWGHPETVDPPTQAPTQVPTPTPTDVPTPTPTPTEVPVPTTTPAEVAVPTLTPGDVRIPTLTDGPEHRPVAVSDPAPSSTPSGAVDAGPTAAAGTPVVARTTTTDGVPVSGLPAPRTARLASTGTDASLVLVLAGVLTLAGAGVLVGLRRTTRAARPARAGGGRALSR